MQGLHKIKYDDGDTEMLDLDGHTWHLIPEREDEELIDDGALDQLHSAAEALANVRTHRGPETTPFKTHFDGCWVSEQHSQSADMVQQGYL